MAAGATWIRAAAALASIAASADLIAQDWAIRTGVVGRGEFTDNYYFTATGEESALTLSIIPSLTAVRRTDTTAVTTYLNAGANTVFGASPEVDYFTGRAQVEGSLREERAEWTGSVGVFRETSLQNVGTPAGAVLTLAFVDGAFANAAYHRQLTEQVSLGVRVSGYGNRYSSVQGDPLVDAALEDNTGFSAGGVARQRYSERTTLAYTALYSYLKSDFERTESGSIVAGIAHRFSQELAVSGSAGYYWRDSEYREDAANLNESGPLFGGQVDYAFSESTRMTAGAAQTLTPNATGALARQTSAFVGVWHRATERLLARFGANYYRSTFPRADDTLTNTYYNVDVGATYRIAERWSLEAVVQYAAARYTSPLSEPRSHAVFVSVSYDWPSASYAPGVGLRPERQGFPGAGPVPIPDAASSERGAPVTTDAPTFDWLIHR